MTLVDENKKARSMGYSYGRYKAEQYLKAKSKEQKPKRENKKKTSRRRYTDRQAFELWKSRKSDSEIGAALGVSRQIIQRWRDTMELPSSLLPEVDVTKYRIVETPAGMFAVMDD